jgi:hypothetical protein
MLSFSTKENLPASYIRINSEAFVPPVLHTCEYWGMRKRFNMWNICLTAFKATNDGQKICFPGYGMRPPPNPPLTVWHLTNRQQIRMHISV